MSNADEMRKLMENFQPKQQMDVADIPVDNMGAMHNNGDMNEYAPDMDNEEAVSTEIIDALEGEFKRLTTEFLQTGGELDAAGLTDIREKLGKHMASILDVLHNGWMDNMMDQDGGSAEGGEHDHDSDDTPAFMQSDNDSDEAEDSDSDDDSDEADDSDEDDSDDDNGYNFESKTNESVAEAMRRIQNKLLNK